MDAFKCLRYYVAKTFLCKSGQLFWASLFLSVKWEECYRLNSWENGAAKCTKCQASKCDWHWAGMAFLMCGCAAWGVSRDLGGKGPGRSLYQERLHGWIPGQASIPALTLNYVLGVPKLRNKTPPAIDWIVSPQNSHVEALFPNVTVFGKKPFREVIKLKWGHKVGALIW